MQSTDVWLKYLMTTEFCTLRDLTFIRVSKRKCRDLELLCVGHVCMNMSLTNILFTAETWSFQPGPFGACPSMQPTEQSLGFSENPPTC